MEDQDQEVDINAEIFLEIDIFGMMDLAAADERIGNENFLIVPSSFLM